MDEYTSFEPAENYIYKSWQYNFEYNNLSDIIDFCKSDTFKSPHKEFCIKLFEWADCKVPECDGCLMVDGDYVFCARRTEPSVMLKDMIYVINVRQENFQMDVPKEDNDCIII